VKIVANRLTHHLLEWGSGARVVLLLHGFLEHAHVWSLVAPRLAAGGWHVYALDWRGHGESDWVGAGGYYHFADYVADLAAVVRALGTRVALVAHSMGGNAALLYAGSAPQQVTSLVAIEGLGPGDADPADTPARYAQWCAGLELVAARPRPTFTLAAAATRLRARYPRMGEEAIALLAAHGTRVVAGDQRAWVFDPLHQTRSPQPFYVAQARPFWQRIACPVLYVEGDESPLRYPEEELRDRLATLRAARVVIRGSAHHPHLEQPAQLAGALLAFLV
jgi:pimeloyl-ACP methyl ester carboxylesterase